mgnify:CR=1 FL=1
MEIIAKLIHYSLLFFFTGVLINMVKLLVYFIKIIKINYSSNFRKMDIFYKEAYPYMMSGWFYKTYNRDSKTRITKIFQEVKNEYDKIEN